MKGGFYIITVVDDPFKSVVVENDEGKEITVSEGSKVNFTIESTGELKEGVVTKFTGKGEKLEIEIMPVGCEHKETWAVINMAEGSLKVVE